MFKVQAPKLQFRNYSLVFLFLISLSAFSQSKCSSVKKGTFSYTHNGKKVKVIFDEDTHIELHEGGKQYIKSKINWTNDCEYEITVKESNIKGTPVYRGSILRVKIRKIKGEKVYFTSTYRGLTWNGKLQRQEEDVVASKL